MKTTENKINNASDAKYAVYELIQNLGDSVLLGLFTNDIMLKVNGKQYKIDINEVIKK